jgi:methylated-DNA-protein-cysteine methyltransferase-like protein
MDSDLVFDRIRRIPAGFVTTYGSLTPGAPRHAGRLLSEAPPGIPWWRVVRADGTLAKGSEQQRMLVAEGVPMRAGRVLMKEAFIPADHFIQDRMP